MAYNKYAHDLDFKEDEQSKRKAEEIPQELHEFIALNNDQKAQPQNKQLSRFKSAYESASRIKQSKMKPNKNDKKFNQQELDLIPCPFCAVPLTLDQLEHIDQCLYGKQCQNCKERYPLFLFKAHESLCIRKAIKKSKIPQEKPDFQKRWGSNQIPKKIQEKQKSENLKKSSKKELRVNNILQKKQKQASVNRVVNNQKLEPNPRPVIKQNHQQQPIDPRVYQQQSRLRKQDQKGLSSNQIKRLVVDMFLPSQSGSQNQCAICMVNLQPQDLIIRLPCLHIFHEDCLLPWLQDKSTCPSCKNKIVLR